jgi:hypothetical protein
MTRTLAVSAFVAACLLGACNKSEPETTPAPEPSAATAPAPAQDTTMAAEPTTDSTTAAAPAEAAPAETMPADSGAMPMDSTMSMPADSSSAQ